MKTSLLAFCLLLSCLFVAAKVVPSNTINAYYEGRSGDILITPSVENIKSDASLYLRNAGSSYTSQEIIDSSIAELISHLMGTTPLSVNTNRAAFPKTDFFKKPQANLLVVVDATDALFEQSRVGNRITVIPSALPIDRIASLATISTGSTPSNHGIVGRSWLNAAGARETAYIGTAQPAVVSYADILSQTFQGLSLTVSISGDLQMASALAAHSNTFHSKPSWNNYAYFWDSKTEQVESVSAAGRLERDFTRSKSELIQNLAQNLKLEDSGISITQQGEEVIVRLFTGSVSFSLSEAEDLRFFVEMQMISSLASNLQTEYIARLVNDDLPDFFAVSVSTLEAIKNSEKFNAAARVADAVIRKLVSQLEAIYKNSIVSEVVFLGSPLAPVSAEVVSTTNLLLEHDVASEKVEEALLPNVYLKSYISSSQRAADCAAITRSLADFDVVVYCPERAFSPLAHHSLRDILGDNTTTVQLSTDQLTHFQVIFWLIPVLVLAVYFAVYAVCSISTGKDTILVAAAAHKK